MISDAKAELATKYGSQGGGKYFKRSVYVTARTARLRTSEPKFNALAQDGYDKLAARHQAGARELKQDRRT
jgi:hypothetical protein